MHHVFPHRLAAAAGVTLVLALSACGSDSGGSEVASLGTGPTDNATGDSVADVDSQEALLAYAACMRENGVDMDDPTFDAEGNLSGGGFGPGSGLDRSSDEFQTAQEACGDLIEGVDFGPGGGGGGGGLDFDSIQNAMNDFTACLRDEGIAVDDITMGGGAGGPGGPNGSIPAGGPPADGSLPPGGFDGGPNGTPPEGGQGGPGGGGGFDPTTLLIGQLGLDDTDPAVSAALETCQPIMENALQTPTTEA
jgi:hypothetical protein